MPSEELVTQLSYQIGRLESAEILLKDPVEWILWTIGDMGESHTPKLVKDIAAFLEEKK